MSCSRDQVVDAERLLGEAERRWQALLTEHPDLGPAVDLQRRLVSRSLELGVTIDTRPPRGVGVAPGVAVVKLRRKQPVFAGEVLEIDATVLKPFVPGFCEDFALGGAGAPAERLHGTLEHGEIDVWSLLAASLARHQDAIRTKAHHVRVAPDLLWLVAELGIGPLAHRAQRAFLTETAEAHQALGSALAGWQEGYCPACGSWPAFAETVEHTRSLRCSFCGRGWSPAVYRCIYCGEAGESFLTGADDPDHPSRRVELCRSCGGYLKNVDAKTRTPFELLPVADLATSDLDVGAAGRGYTRPRCQTCSPYNRSSR